MEGFFLCKSLSLNGELPYILGHYMAGAIYIYECRVFFVPPIEHFALRNEDNASIELHLLGTVVAQLLPSQHLTIHKRKKSAII